MKHKVTVEVKTKKHFLGIPYETTEKKRITVDGKTLRKMKKKEQEDLQELAAAGELLMWEEEIAEMLEE